jgi:hypothetical protein
MAETGARSGSAVKPNRRRALAPLTELRAERLRAALTLFEVAQAAGLPSYKVSIVERGLVDGSPEEISLLRAAIAKLVRKRGQEQAR